MNNLRHKPFRLIQELSNDSENVGFFHDQQVFAADFHFCAGPFAKQNAVACFNIQSYQLAAFIAVA
ncbi:hypothetical protein D3C77_773630 [compost metagenome]